MTLQKYVPNPRPSRRKNLWFERVMAIAATVNLTLVVFDLTYVSWRNFWLQGNIPIPFTTTKIHVPIPMVDCRDRSVEFDAPPRTIRQSAITCAYDPVKGIEPNRDTEQYLDTVQQLEDLVFQQGVTVGLQSPQGQRLLTQLQQQSTEMITLNPFEAVGKSGTLEKIKNTMRDRVRDRTKLKKLSSSQAFQIFWSTNNPTAPAYLTPATWKEEMTWFNSKLRPLLATNYYRSIGENGEPTSYFWIIDAPFVTLFFLEFLARTFYVSRRYVSLNWLDAMVWRWYDVPLFLPFSLLMPSLALLRVVPTGLRLHQAELVDFQAINARARQGFVGAIAEEITEVVVVQVVNQLQDAVRRGELSQFLERSSTSRQYVDINNINEVEVISKQLMRLVVHQTLPQVKPELEALLNHTVSSILNQSPAYRGLTALPGVGAVPAQITERLVSEVIQAMYNSLQSGLEDEKSAQLTAQLVQKFGSTFMAEARQQDNLEELQLLISDLLEEIKINYIQRLSAEDATMVLDQTRRIKQQMPVNH